MTKKTWHEKTEETLQRASKAEKEFESLKNRISTSIKNLEDTISKMNSTLEKVNETEQSATDSHKKIIEYHNELTSGDEESPSIILSIDNSKDEINSSVDEVNEKVKLFDSQIKEINSFYKRVIGIPDPSGKVTGGLRQELDERNKQLDEYEEQQRSSYKAINEQVESLLPGATSAGLASAYKDLKDSYDTPIKNATRMFYSALFGIFILGFMSITEEIGWNGIKLLNTTDPILILNSLFFKLPLLIPLLWLTLHSSKRRSENRRLQQEYAHKEALAKSYESFKTQILALKKEESEPLLRKLLEATIDTIGFNASTTLDGKHGDGMPLQENLRDLLSEIKNRFPTSG